MHPFELIRVNDVPQAFQKATNGSSAQSVRFVAGGTTLIDLMKLNVERPRQVIDINGLPLNKIELLKDGGLKIGASAQFRFCASSERHSGLSCSVASAAFGCFCATAEHGNNGGKPVAKDAMRLFSRYILCHVTSANREAAVQRSKGSIERWRPWYK
jgi:molybdopterin-dependent oxidoreductase-like protein